MVSGLKSSRKLFFFFFLFSPQNKSQQSRWMLTILTSRRGWFSETQWDDETRHFYDHGLIPFIELYAKFTTWPFSISQSHALISASVWRLFFLLWRRTDSIPRNTLKTILRHANTAEPNKLQIKLMGLTNITAHMDSMWLKTRKGICGLMGKLIMLKKDLKLADSCLNCF